jgi:hypothetical protein
MKDRRMGKARSCGNGAGNLTDTANCVDNVGSSTSHGPIGLHGLLRGELYFYLTTTNNFKVMVLCR